MKRWIASLCLALGLAWAAPALAQDEADFGALFPSIVRVVGLSAEGGISLGSGVVIGKADTGSYVITNYHVIAEANAAGIRIVAPNPGAEAKPTIAAARYVRGDAGTDIAILYVPNFSSAPVLPLSVGTARENLPVRAIGYPGTDMQQWRTLKDKPTMTAGIVSTMETAPWRAGYPAVGQVQHTADLNEGMSGGPLLDICGRVLAVNTAFNSVAHGSNLALSAADITPYLQQLNISYETDNDACDPAAYRAKLAATAATAAAAKAKAEQDAKLKADKKDQQQLIIAGATAAAVLLAGLVGVFVWQRSRGGGKPKIVTPPPVEPPPGIILRGVNEAAGKVRVIRGEELANQIGVELGKSDAFGSPGTSRRHARLLWYAGQGLVLRDVGSMNGTRVNGQEIKGAPDRVINIGDIIEFGAPDARYQVEKL